MLIISYIVKNNKLIFIFNTLINSKMNSNIFINKNFTNILNIKKLQSFQLYAIGNYTK